MPTPKNLGDNREHVDPISTFHFVMVRNRNTSSEEDINVPVASAFSQIPIGTALAAGIVRLATEAEVLAGIHASAVVTPATLAALIATLPSGGEGGVPSNQLPRYEPTVKTVAAHRALATAGSAMAVDTLLLLVVGGQQQSWILESDASALVDDGVDVVLPADRSVENPKAWKRTL